MEEVMVEKDDEGEEDALVKNSTGVNEPSDSEERTLSRGVGRQGKGESTSCSSSSCFASLGTICCRGHRRKDNKGKYSVSTI